METQPQDSAAIRSTIHQFLQERLKPKLEKLKEGEEEKRRQLLEAHQPEAWIADAARRVVQIQQVTHAGKYTHPDARSTNLSHRGNPAAGDALIGTHTLDPAAALDVVGNAAALDVFKFLRLENNGKSLLQRAIESDPALTDALPGDPEQKQAWIAAFASLPEPKGQLSTDKLSKQLYWPLDDGGYHLLAPLFPSTLAHRVYEQAWQDRFSEEAKAARKAYWEKEPYPHEYREYPNLAIQKFGGTKPQNISQLNSERHGEAWLLPNLPPSWRNRPLQPPLEIESVFDRRFENWHSVWKLVRTLRDYLVRVQKRNTVDIRKRRAQLVGQICDELIQFAAEIQELPPGWSADPDCRLNADECCWLDPWRTEEDPEFAAARAAADWREAVSRRFGNWLNARLETRKTPMDDAAHVQWKSDLHSELRMFREELESHE